MSKLIKLTNANGKSTDIPYSKYLQIDINKGDSVFIQKHVSDIEVDVINHTEDVKIMFDDKSIIVFICAINNACPSFFV